MPDVFAAFLWFVQVLFGAPACSVQSDVVCVEATMELTAPAPPPPPPESGTSFVPVRSEHRISNGF